MLFSVAKNEKEKKRVMFKKKKRKIEQIMVSPCNGIIYTIKNDLDLQIFHILFGGKKMKL